MKVGRFSFYLVLTAVGLAVLTAACGSSSEQLDIAAPGPIVRVGSEPIEINTNRIRVETSEVDVDGTVRFYIANWQVGIPVALFLLTDEQNDLDFMGLRDADKVLLGEVEAEDGKTVYEFVLHRQYETQDGKVLNISSGMEMNLLAFQSPVAGSSSTSTGPSFSVR